MTTFFSNNSREINELRALLRNPELQRSDNYVDTIKRAIMYMTLGMDVSSLFSEMIMATSTRNLVQKKLVYLYLCNYADTNSELSLLVINTLQKDCRDENPTVRGLALRSLCSLRVPNIVEYITVPLKTSLTDVSAYVRKTAVLGCVKLYHLSPKLVKESDVVDKLYTLLRDRDPVVVSNSLCALDEILADEGGMALNRPLALHLFQQLKNLNEWGQCIALNILARYHPENEDEVYTLLNLLDERLKHNNSAVVMAAIKLFILYTESLEHLHEDVYGRVKEPLVTLLSSGNAELSYVCLAHLQLLNVRAPHFLEQEYKFFFLRFNDPSYVRSQKLGLLVDIATANNAAAIMDELSEYVTDVNTGIACRSIRSLGEIAAKVGESALNAAVEKLLSFADLDVDYISAETLVVMKDLLLRFPHRANDILTKLKFAMRVVDNVDAKAALLFMLGEYAELVDDAPYIIEPLIDHLKDERSSVVRLSLLTATMKMFFRRPAETQAMLGRLLQMEISGEITLLTEPHDRALLYYRLLQRGVDVAREIIDAPREQANAANELEDRAKLDKLFNELNSLAVIYRRPSELFIQQTPPYAKVPMPQSMYDVVATATPPAQQHQRRAPQTQSLPEPLPIPVAAAPAPAPAPVQPAVSLLDDFFSPPPAAAAPIPVRPGPQLQLFVGSRLDPKAFQKAWGAYSIMSNFQATLSAANSTVASIESAVTARGELATMASGGTGDLLKFYFYGQDRDTDTMFLIEVKVTPSINYYTVTIKAGPTPEAAVFNVDRDVVAKLQEQLEQYIRAAL